MRRRRRAKQKLPELDHDRLRKVAAGYLRPYEKHLADDCVQEAFERYYREPRYRRGKEPERWFYWAVRNFAKNLSWKLRNRRKLLRRHYSEESRRLKQRQIKKKDPLLDAEESAEALLTNLTLTDRKLCWAWAIDGLSYRQLAKKFRIAIGTVANRIDRIKAQLREDPIALRAFSDLNRAA